MHFLCYTPLLLLVYLFQGITAYPVNHNHGNGRSESNPTIWPSSQTTSGWRMFHAINPWNAHSNGNKMEHNHQRLQVIDIPQHKNHAPKSFQNSIPARKADSLSVYPTTQGIFGAIGDFDKVLVPVSVLMAMVWLAFLAGGLVAIVDYVWVRWGRDYSGYSSSMRNTKDEEKDISKVEEGGEVKVELNCAEEDELD